MSRPGGANRKQISSLLIWLLLAVSSSQAAELPLDTQDLVFLTPTRPLVVRLQIKVDSQPFREVWRERFDRLFDRFDTDHDGSLDAAAAAKLTALMGAPAPRSPRRIARAATVAAAASSVPVVREELLSELEKMVYPFALSEVLSIGRGSAPALFPLLDANADGRLSAEEFSHAEEHLMLRDFDDDHVLTEAELLASPHRAAEDKQAETAVQSPTSVPDTVFMLGPMVDLQKVAAGLLKRYDLDKNGTLDTATTPPELAADSKFMALDASGDGRLSAAELEKLADVAPDVSVELAYGPKSAAARSRQRRTTAAGEVRTRRKLDGGYKIQLPDLEIDLMRNNRNPAENSDLRFANFDFDSNGYIDASEASQNQTTRNIFSALDADGDKKVFPGEFREYFDNQAGASVARFTLRVTNRGQDLFTMLDSNGDSTLSQRELREASQIVAREDRDGDAALAGGEIPQRIKLELLRGDGQTDNNMQFALNAARTPRTPTPRAPAAGPKWLRKMDRNRDGEVSADEFLGPPANFKKLDADQDGFIEAAEADAAKTP